MLRLLHITDIHFGPPHRDELDALVRSLIESERPDALLVSGDLTQRATRRQFEAARAFLKSLSLPQVVVPGNHDVPLFALHERLASPFARYRKYLSPELEPQLKLPGAWIFGINTAKGFTGKNGIFRPAALARCESFFAQAPAGTLRMVVAHHHLLPAPGHFYDPVAARARAAVQAFGRAGVDLVVSGHLHHGFLANVRDHFPKINHEIRVLHAGTSMSRRGRGAERGANSVNLVEASPREITIRQLRYTTESAAFLPAMRYVIPRALPIASGSSDRV